MFSVIGPTTSSSGAAPRARTAAGAAQNRADARHQFARIEGLAQIVVGAEFETDDAVDVVAARREHQDGRLVGRAELAQHVEAADARQHHVENHDFKFGGPQFRQRIAAVVHAFHVEMFGVQILGEHLTELAVIIDQQHARLGIAGSVIFCILWHSRRRAAAPARRIHNS